MAFFGYSYHLGQIGNHRHRAGADAALRGLVGACVGFLPHNFASARIFMGDSGSMLIGLMLASRGDHGVEQADPQSLGIQPTLPLYLPLILPLAVLALPLFDLMLAVLRRHAAGPVTVRARQGAPAPPADGDGAQPSPGGAAPVLLVGAAGLRRGGHVLQHRAGWCWRWWR